MMQLSKRTARIIRIFTLIVTRQLALTTQRAFLMLKAYFEYADRHFEDNSGFVPGLRVLLYRRMKPRCPAEGMCCFRTLVR